MTSLSPLFRTFQCGALKLPNRVVMAPMTRCFSPQGVPTRDVAEYYRRRAEGDVGLIITEGTAIARPAARNNPNVPNFHGDALEGWANVVESVHGAGGRIAPQLWHVGSAPDSMQNSPLLAAPESPSGLFSAEKRVGEGMSDADIEAVIAAFVDASVDAKRLGFDCIEFHAAHGYLLDQFFWPVTNLRADRYGGATIAERVRFGVEIVREVRAAVGEDYPLIMRISQWKQQDYGASIAATPDELGQWLLPLAEAGVDIFDCSQRRFWEPEFKDSPLNLAGWVKKITGRPTITVGSIGLDGGVNVTLGKGGAMTAPIEKMLERLERDEFDLVAIGRALISNPDWLIKVRDGRTHELRSFFPADVERLW